MQALEEYWPRYPKFSTTKIWLSSWQANRLIIQQLSSAKDLVRRYTFRLLEPAMFMRGKTLHLWCRNNRHHTQLDNSFTRQSLNLGHNRTRATKSQLTITHTISLCLSLQKANNSLSIHSTEISRHRIPTISSLILIDFECSISVCNVHFFFFHNQVCRHHWSGYFSTVCAVAQVAARLCEELVVVDGYGDASAETTAA